jgi:hypothetical protein
MSGKDILHARMMGADGYVAYLNGDRLSPNSVRSAVAEIGCFYTYLSRHYNCVKNVFTGVKLPGKVNAKLTVIPDATELKAIIEYVRERNSKLVCVIELISRKGFRCGAFERMAVYRSGKFSTVTKGKQFTGRFDEYEMWLIRENFGPVTGDSAVFAEMTAVKIKNYFKHFTASMRDSGLIRESYSLCFHLEITLRPTIPNKTMTHTANYIQSRIKPLVRSQVAKYKQKGLNPSILEGRTISRFPNIANNSFPVCSHEGLSEICMPLESLISCPHVFKFIANFLCEPIRFFMPFLLWHFGTEAQPHIRCRLCRHLAIKAVKACLVFYLCQLISPNQNIQRIHRQGCAGFSPPPPVLPTLHGQAPQTATSCPDF